MAVTGQDKSIFRCSYTRAGRRFAERQARGFLGHGPQKYTEIVNSCPLPGIRERTTTFVACHHPFSTPFLLPNIFTKLIFQSSSGLLLNHDNGFLLLRGAHPPSLGIPAHADLCDLLQACGDVLTKKKLDAHHRQCQGSSFTCLDCMTHFRGTDFRSHTVRMFRRTTYNRCVSHELQVGN